MKKKHGGPAGAAPLLLGCLLALGWAAPWASARLVQQPELEAALANAVTPQPTAPYRARQGATK